MSIKVRYKGWNVYTDWGSLYRLWKFTETYEPMEAEEGFDLHDRGPDVEPRFQVRTWRDRKWKTVHKPDKEAVRELLGHLPPWNPPPEANRELRDLAKHAKGLEQEIRSLRLMMMSFGSRAGSGEQGQQAGASNGHGDEPACEQENEYLRLTNTGTYANTNDGYRIWELKQDAPSVPVFHTKGVKGKPHAQKSDELWEELDDDDLTPFKLKRGGRRIGNPEWWMVRHLFEGLDAAEEYGGADPGRSRSLEESVIPGGIKRWVQTGRRPIDGEWKGPGPRAYLWAAKRSVPELRIREGDVLLKVSSNSRSEWCLETWKCQKRQLRREDLPVVSDNLDAFRLIASSWDTRHELDPDDMRDLKRYVNAGAARRSTNDASVKLWALRPWGREVSEPIRAKSDDGAIFELLSEIGCRPPEEKS